jgi:cyanophycinase
MPTEVTLFRQVTWKGRALGVVGPAFLTLFIVSAGEPLGVRTEASRIEADAVHGGALVIAGGGCVTAETRDRFVALAGGSNSRIVVIPAVDPVKGHEDDWLEPWRRHGAGSVELLNAKDRPFANDPAFCAPLKRATGVWISGGYQSLLAERYVDTAVEDGLREVLRRGGVVGGCSAGAAILSGVMIEEGEETPVEARGLGLMSAVIDQHFLQRNRLWRLQQMLETHPDLIGIGVDEGMALVFEPASGRLTPLGDSYALVCLPRSASEEPRIEVLKAGDNVSLSELKRSHLAYHPPVEAATKLSEPAA